LALLPLGDSLSRLFDDPIVVAGIKRLWGFNLLLGGLAGSVPFGNAPPVSRFALCLVFASRNFIDALLEPRNPFRGLLGCFAGIVG
jgi:hypothetical protein